MVRYYRLKNYLNASHFVVFNGIKGEVHPHTWEFSALLYSTGNEITKFTDTEKAIRSIFDPYQNKVINDLKPFDEIVPSLENITEYFVKRIQEAVKPFGYRLVEFEGSETPVRTYGVLLENRNMSIEPHHESQEEPENEVVERIVNEESEKIVKTEEVNVSKILDRLDRGKR
jgi:6-pyruvoyltetrahydropterin/6-carboxytetrahydropterin synthase